MMINIVLLACWYVVLYLVPGTCTGRYYVGGVRRSFQSSKIQKKMNEWLSHVR